MSSFMKNGVKLVDNDPSSFLFDYLEIKYPEESFNDFIYVGIQRQLLHYFKEGKLFKSYPVSTSKHGAGTEVGSNMTPVGLHVIKNKYGDDVPLGGIFSSRRYTGRIAEIQHEAVATGKDEITTRILTLDGQEEGINKGEPNDSYERRIYVHGTSEEGLIGKPASHGCIRMKNKDIVELYKLVKPGMNLVILNN